MTGVDEANRQVFDSPAVVASFPTTGGWNTAGERLAVQAAAPRARDRPVLDLGVGGGRTTGLLRLLSDDYLGLDYSPRAVERARQAHPGVDLRVGDARDLSALAQAHYALVVFSDNAIDALDHAGRAAALRSIAGVLAPGGVLVLSTHRLGGDTHRRRPWRRHPLPPHPGNPLVGAALRAGAAARAARHLPMRARAYAANRRRVVDHGDWALAPLAALDYRVVCHFTTVAALRAELAAVGLVVEAVYDAQRGSVVDDGDGDADTLVAVASRPG